MQTYNITGMSCAACSARIEKTVKALKGVDECSVNLLTNSMTVSGSILPENIIKAVENAGYGATLNGAKKTVQEVSTETKQISVLKKRLIYSLGFLGILMYISMGYTMWGLPLPSFLKDNYIAIALTELLLTVAVMIINKQFFISGIKGLLHRAPNMDTLVALGSSAGFIYSTAVLFIMTDLQLKGNYSAVHHSLHNLYFESGAMILALITLGKLLEAKSKGKTTNALKGLMNLSPKTATVLKDGKEITVSAEEVAVGDIFIVKPGESIVADGIVLDGLSAVDESNFSGESIPIEKSKDSKVTAGTVNQNGFLKCKALKIGEDTAISKIIKLVNDASATKAPIAKIADKVSGIFVPTVIVISIITIIAWLIAGQTVGYSLARGISVLVISCPCALGLATPVAIMVANGKGAKNGILFKNAISLEQTGKTDIVVLDKTGTVTQGSPAVTDVLPYSVSETQLLTIAYSLEKPSEHPLSKAIVDYCENAEITAENVTDFKAISGSGIVAFSENDLLKCGNLTFIGDCVPEEYIKTADTYSANGKTPLFFSKNNTFCGIIAVCDTIKPDSKSAIKELQNLGLRVIMLTGDNKRTANALGKQSGIDEIFSEVLPDGKEKIISDLKKLGKVMMVGDGINDAPALTSADIGVAIGSGTDIAIDAADIVLIKSTLSDVVSAICLSRSTIKIIRQNLFWAFVYNCIGIPLAAGVFVSMFGWQLNPMFGAAAMSLSSVCVISNALRLNFFKINKSEKYQTKRRKTMSVVTTLKIEGMMCSHCENHVKKALETLENVTSVTVSHSNGTAVVESTQSIPDEVFVKAITAEGYKVLNITD